MTVSKRKTIRRNSDLHVVTFKAKTAEIEAWKLGAAFHQNLSRWIRETLNAASAGIVDGQALANRLKAATPPKPTPLAIVPPMRDETTAVIQDGTKPLDIAGAVAEGIRLGIAAVLAAAGTPQAEAPSSYVPTPIPPIPPGITTIPISPEETERRRQRGQVNKFINMQGDAREWTGRGPNPLEPGCTILPEVLEEYAQRLDILRDVLADKAREAARYARA